MFSAFFVGLGIRLRRYVMVWVRMGWDGIGMQEAKKVSDSIDEQIRLDKQRLRTEKDIVKVLLLGQSESGKSTTLKRTSSPPYSIYGRYG